MHCAKCTSFRIPCMYLCATGSMSYVFRSSRFLRYSLAPFIWQAGMCITVVLCHFLFPRVSFMYASCASAYCRSAASATIRSSCSSTLCSPREPPSWHCRAVLDRTRASAFDSPRSRVSPFRSRRSRGAMASSVWPSESWKAVRSIAPKPAKPPARSRRQAPRTKRTKCSMNSAGRPSPTRSCGSSSAGGSLQSSGCSDASWAMRLASLSESSSPLEGCSSGASASSPAATLAWDGPAAQSAVPAAAAQPRSRCTPRQQA
mmetsp:Transcript_96583/g.288329  ORF Transcript_96583/g.288329 Transcript_96583/m.288329 type:complete len:260 (-) Transcript_96583:179-958(-)